MRAPLSGPLGGSRRDTILPPSFLSPSDGPSEEGPDEVTPRRVLSGPGHSARGGVDAAAARSSGARHGTRDGSGNGKRPAGLPGGAAAAQRIRVQEVGVRAPPRPLHEGGVLQAPRLAPRRPDPPVRPDDHDARHVGLRPPPAGLGQPELGRARLGAGLLLAGRLPLDVRARRGRQAGIRRRVPQDLSAMRSGPDRARARSARSPTAQWSSS